MIRRSDCPEDPVVSIIVVNYNGRAFLGDCIGSLADQDRCRIEVIVVDNGSSDGSIEHLAKEFPWVRIIRKNTNLGFAGGVNAGIRKARGTIILTLNNDARVEKGCIEALQRALERQPLAGMAAAKMLFPDHRINSTGICISMSGAAWDRGMFEPDVGQYDEERDVFGPCAGAAMYRREMLDEIGLFDEDFFLYMEDVDLAFRGRLAGWSCIYVPEAVVYHFHGGTAGFQSDLTVYYGNRNILWYPVKNFPFFLLIAALPWIIGRNLSVVAYYALRNQGRIILKSKIDGLRGLPKMVKKRSGIKRDVPIKEIQKFLRAEGSKMRGLNVDN